MHGVRESCSRSKSKAVASSPTVATRLRKYEYDGDQVQSNVDHNRPPTPKRRNKQKDRASDETGHSNNPWAHNGSGPQRTLMYWQGECNNDQQDADNRGAKELGARRNKDAPFFPFYFGSTRLRCQAT